jgi:hypothetical protein
MISPRTDTSKCPSVLAALGYIDKLFSDNEKTRITDEYPFDTSDFIRALDIPHGLVREPSDSFIRVLSFGESPTETTDRLSLDARASIWTFSVDDKPLQDLLTSGLWHGLHDDFSSTHAPALDNDEIEQSRGWYSFTIIDSQPEMAAIKKAYELRIDDLRDMAKDEGIKISSRSEADFWELIDALTHASKAQLVLSQEGVLAAIWKDGDANYVHFRFLGTGHLRYVIITDSLHDSSGESEVGDCSIQDVKALLEKHNLENLLGLYVQ